MAEYLNIMALLDSSPSRVVMLPAGAWEIGTITLDRSVRFIGAGPHATKLWGHIIQRTNESICMDGMMMYPLETTVPAFCVPDGFNPDGNLFRWFSLAGFDTPMKFYGGNRMLFDFCYFADWRIGIDMANTHDPDNGDSIITNCTFDSANPDAYTSVFQSSAGGLRFVCNKFLRGQWAYVGKIDGKTSDLIGVANSIENQTVGGFHAEIMPGGDFSNIVFTGNQFAGAGMTLFDFPGIQRVELGCNVANCPPKAAAPVDSAWVAFWRSLGINI